LKPNPNTLEANWPQYDGSAASGITQQYSSATFVLLCPHFREEKFGVLSKDLFFF
jgi:hypothetical protein